MSSFTSQVLPALKIPRLSNLQQHSSSVAAAAPVVPLIPTSAHPPVGPPNLRDNYSVNLHDCPPSSMSSIKPPLWSYPSASPTATNVAAPTGTRSLMLASQTTSQNCRAHRMTPNTHSTGDLIVEFKASGTRGNYNRMPLYISHKIKEYMNKSLVAFWIKNHLNGAFLLFDFETMQQVNVSTGFRRTIRCINNNTKQIIPRKRKRQDMQRVNSIDLTNSNVTPMGTIQSSATSSVSASSVANVPINLAQPSSTPNTCAKKNVIPVEVCGSAYKVPIRCGEVARRKLRQIRLLQLSRCSFVQDMRALAPEQRLFNPDPIPEDDSRFPLQQIKNLERGGLTVHEVSPSVAWSRNHRYFELLYEDEKKLYAAHATNDGPAKIKHFAWHGAPADNIRGILQYGFLVGPTPRVGNRYGHGVYLSTESYGRYSMNPTYSKPDDSGFRFMLLCEVLPGTVEASKSQQTRPSSLTVHSGVDQLPGASMHVFYTCDMNARISPKYLVIIHPRVTEEIMNSVPNEFTVPTAVAVAETIEPSSGLVVIDCT